MSRELLAALDLDAERLLFAGARVAHADGDLAARTELLAPLAARAPAIARIVEQVEELRSSSGQATAVELLNLSALMLQVRRVQAAPDTPRGELAPLPPAVPIESPLPPPELAALVDALAHADEIGDRRQVIAEAVERGAARDLRLLPFCIPALGDPEIARVVERKLLPALGEGIAPELLASLDLGGGESDVRKLRALAAIRKAGAKPLLHEALERGFADMRAAALVALAELDPGEAEPIALRLLSSDRSAEVRAAALEALGACASDRALDTLATHATSGVLALRNEAHRSLARSPHPRATERLLSLLTPGLLALAPFEPPEASPPEQRAAAHKAQEKHREDVRDLRFLVDLLGRRRDKQAVQALIGLLGDHAIDLIRETAAGALVESGSEEASEAILSSMALGRIKGTFLWEFTGANREKAFELVVRLASGRPDAGLALAIVQILTSRRDPRVPRLLLGLLDMFEQDRARRAVLEAIHSYGDATVNPPPSRPG